MTDQTPFPQAKNEPRLYGVIDVLRSDRVAGWVIDRTDAARFATVEIYREGRLVGTVAANRERKDLQAQAVGTGSYGFASAFDPPLEAGMEFTVSVIAKSHDGVELTLQPTARAAATLTAEKRILGRILSELSALRAEIGTLRQEVMAAEAGRNAFQDRLELVQLRLEGSISVTDAPPGPSSAWLTIIACSGAVIAFGSLAIGIFSLWAG